MLVGKLYLISKTYNRISIIFGGMKIINQNLMEPGLNMFGRKAQKTVIQVL